MNLTKNHTGEVIPTQIREELHFFHAVRRAEWFISMKEAIANVLKEEKTTNILGFKANGNKS